MKSLLNLRSRWAVDMIVNIVLCPLLILLWGVMAYWESLYGFIKAYPKREVVPPPVNKKDLE